jgi:hypothetical protein
MAQAFLTDIQTLRQRARQHIEQDDLAKLLATLDPTKKG